MYGNTFLFGGLPVLFAGDFNQLGPVKNIYYKRYGNICNQTEEERLV